MTLDYATAQQIEKGYDLPEAHHAGFSQIQLVRYAGASGDFNPIHVVPQVAESVGLPGTIVHGMLVMAFVGRTLTEWAGVGSIRRLKTRFSGMTLPGEALVCRANVTKTENTPGGVLLHGRFKVVGAADDSLKLKGDFTVAVPQA